MVTEIAIYRIKSSHLDRFDEIRREVFAAVAQFPGFVGLSTKREINDAATFIDVCEWDSKKSALSALECFRELPVAKRFREYFDGETVFLGHFGSLSEIVKYEKC